MLRGPRPHGHRCGGHASTGRRPRRGTASCGRTRRACGTGRRARACTPTARRTRRGRRRAAPGRLRRARRSGRSRRTGRRRTRRAAAPVRPSTRRASARRCRRSIGRAPRPSAGSPSGSSATSSWRKQKNPLSPSTRRSTSLAVGPKPGIAVDPLEEGRREARARPFDQVGRHRVRLARHQDERLEVRVVLAGEAVEDLVEPGARVVHHHHRHDGRCELPWLVHRGGNAIGTPAADQGRADPRDKVLAIVSASLYDACSGGVHPPDSAHLLPSRPERTRHDGNHQLDRQLEQHPVRQLRLHEPDPPVVRRAEERAPGRHRPPPRDPA